MNDRQEKIFYAYSSSLSADGREVQVRYGLPGKPKNGIMTVPKPEKQIRISRPPREGDIKVKVHKGDGLGDILMEETVPRDSEVGEIIETHWKKIRAILITKRQKIEEAEAELADEEELIATFLTQAEYDEIYEQFRYNFECLMRYVN